MKLIAAISHDNYYISFITILMNWYNDRLLPLISPPYSFILPKIISKLKGRRFEEAEVIKTNAAKELLALHANEFGKCLTNNFTSEHKSM
jgi:hypothetical protein